MIWAAAALICGAAGGYLAWRVKLPAGVMIGAMVGAALFGLITGKGAMPAEVKVLTQAVSGIFIGMRIKKSDLPILKRVLLPAVASAAAMVGLCIGMGAIIGIISGLDRTTAMLGCAPGGIMDMSLIAMDLHADAPVISVLHMVRLAAVVGVFPSLLKPLAKRLEGKGVPEKIPPKPAAAQGRFPEPVYWMLTGLVGGCMGVIGKLSGIPAGTLLFSMVGTAVLSITTSKAKMPAAVKRGAQTLAGTLIGTGITLEALLTLKSLLLPALLMLILYFGINLLLAFVLHKIWKFSMRTAFFSCTPGGASDICLMAEELGGDPTKISIMQSIRAMLVVALYPIFL